MPDSMSFDRHADILAKARPVVEKLHDDGGDEKAARERRWKTGLAQFLEPSSAAATLSYVECCHPDPSRGGTDAGMLVGEWRGHQKAAHREPLARLDAYLKADGRLFTQMPIGSWRIQFDFTLSADLYTRDESGFFAIDNPMRRDRALQIPTLAGSSWKGMLRNTWWMVYGRRNLDCELRIFGTDKPGEESGGRENEQHIRGRLHPSSSFFSRIDFAVINSHDRKTKTGQPIFYEVIPKGANATFQLDYIAYPGSHERKDLFSESADDLSCMAIVLAVLFGDLGVGAKTTSGFGRISDGLTNGGCVALMAGTPVEVTPENPKDEPALPHYLEAPGVLIKGLRNDDGSFNENATAEKKADRLILERARKWWAREGKKIWDEKRTGPAEATPVPLAVPVARQVRRCPQTLASLSTIEADIGKVVASIREGCSQ